MPIFHNRKDVTEEIRTGTFDTSQIATRPATVREQQVGELLKGFLQIDPRLDMRTLEIKD